MSYVPLWLIIIGFILLVIGAIVYAIYKSFSAAVWILLGLGILMFIVGLIWWLVEYSTQDRVNDYVKPRPRPAIVNSCQAVAPCFQMQNESMLSGIDYNTSLCQKGMAACV